MSFSDYKAKAAIVAAALTALSAFIGVLPGMMGIALAACCLGLAHAFQDIADHGLTAEGLKNDLEELKKDAELLRSTSASEPPSTIKFPGVPLLLFGLLWLFGSSAIAQDRPTVPTSMQLQPETRAWFKNPDGSCVQCSIGMAGVHCNDLNAASLLWDTAYGPAIRGGSWPSRVEAYCDKRGIKAWSVTGNTVEDTMPWIVWAAKTGRFAAIGAGTSHFQTLYGYEPGADRPWMVCNNNSTQRIDRYTDREFRQLHAASGPWVVILEKPSSDPPSFVQWWK
jgi:hypothetical protein